MNIQEAYKLLEVPEDISNDELKTVYKKLARKFHPDVFKEDPNKFTRINEAYQMVTDYREHPEKYEPRMQQGGGFWNNININDIFSGFMNDQESVQAQQPIRLHVKVSFHESVLGCGKEIKYHRSIKCTLCQGGGHTKIGNGCDKCDGFGRQTTNNKGMIFQSVCAKCQGKGVKKHKCEKCNGKSTIQEQRVGKITVPPGARNGEMLRLAGEGNFAGRHMFGDAHTDVFIEVQVELYKGMILEGKNVCSTFTISLLEALEGTNKEVETVYGNKNITIPAKSKHNEEILIPKCGVKGSDGNHAIKLNIEYPIDIDKLIGVLKDVIPD